jgi:hypothetical protein
VTIRQRRNFYRWLRKRDFRRPWLIVRAVHKTGIAPSEAATMLLKESGGGRNVFGCDHGPQGGRAPWCGEPVTRERVRQLRATGRFNGIGPTQLTHPSWVQRAGWDKVHRPYHNMVAGFGGFREMRRTTDLWGAARAYNGASVYANDFTKREQGIRRSLRGAGVIR